MSIIATSFAALAFVGPGATTAEAPPAPRARSLSLEDGVAVHSADGDFGVGLGFLGQLRHQTDVTSTSTERGFALRLVRPVFTGHLWGDRVRARVMPELAGGTPRLLDASVEVTFHPAFGLELGQYRPWISRGFRTGLPVLTLPDRGAVVDTFRVDRDVGITVRGRPLGGRFEYYVGVLNGNGPSAARVGDGLLYTARVVVAPLGPVGYDQAPYLKGKGALRVAAGLGAYIVEHPDDEVPDATPTARRDVGGSGDMVVSGWRLAGQLEGFVRRHDGATAPSALAWGGYGQLSGLIVRNRLDASLRIGAYDVGEGARLPAEGGLNVYLAGHHAKLQVRYGCDGIVGRVGCTAHRATAQAQLRF